MHTMTEQLQPNNQSTEHNPVGRFMVAAGAVIVHEQTGKILVIQRASSLDWNPGEWEIDYGRIDQFETPEEGLRRELFEEVGLTILNNIKLLRVWHIFRGPQKAENEVIGITYTCTTPTSEVTLSDEHQAYRWVTPEEALDLIKVDGIRIDVKLYQEQRGSK